jgi:hypothetical protein
MADAIGVPYTPDPGQPISLTNIYDVFGKGNEPASPGLELDNYNGVRYWSSFYPFAQGRFPETGQLQLSDFYGKCALDPVIPGTITDYTPGINKTFKIPPFRRYVLVEMWGAGGGAGAGDYSNYYNGSNGTATRVFGVIGINAGGGVGGSAGMRQGNQSGAGGAGGTWSLSYNNLPAGVITGGTNGAPGGNGSAGAGRGSNGGNSPNGGTGGVYGGNGTSNYNGRNAGFNGNPPGGGGGSGGYTDNSKKPSRSAGGAGGGGAYAYFICERSQIQFGQILNYDVGAGGAGGIGNQANGGTGAGGAIKFTWDI